MNRSLLSVVRRWRPSVGLLWVVSDWPIHDIAEDGLVSVHMVEHLTLALLGPPLFLIGLPAWLWGAILEPLVPTLRRLTHPMLGLFLFNAVFAATHWPPIIGLQNRSEWWHFAGDPVLVASAFIMFWPVLSPVDAIPRLSPFRQIGYLFLVTILPTIPASFLTLQTRSSMKGPIPQDRPCGVSTASLTSKWLVC